MVDTRREYNIRITGESTGFVRAATRAAKAESQFVRAAQQATQQLQAETAAANATGRSLQQYQALKARVNTVNRQQVASSAQVAQAMRQEAQAAQAAGQTLEQYRATKARASTQLQLVELGAQRSALRQQARDLNASLQAAIAAGQGNDRYAQSLRASLTSLNARNGAIQRDIAALKAQDAALRSQAVTAAANARRAQIDAFNQSAARGAVRFEQERRALERSRQTLEDYRRSKERAARPVGLGTELRNAVLAGAGISGVVLLMRELVVASTSAALSLERVKNRFAFFTNTDFAATEALQFATDNASQFAQAIDVARDGYARLLVLQDAGIIRTQQARQLNQGFADASAALGASQVQLGQALYGFSQAATSARVQMQEANQIFEALPGLMQAIERQTGLASGELRKLIAAGEFSGATFIDALLAGFKEFEGASKTLAEGPVGAFQEIRNELQLTLEAIGDGNLRWLQFVHNLVLYPIKGYRDLKTTINDIVGALRGWPAEVSTEFGGLTAETVKYRTELEKLGVNVASDAIRQIWEQARDGTISATEALNQARDRYEAIAQEAGRLRDSLKAVREAQIAAFDAQRIQAYKNRIAESNDELKAAKERLNDLVQAEKQAADRIQKIRSELAGQTRSTEEEIRDLRRSQLSEGAQQASRELEISQQIAAAARLTAEAKQAETEQERELKLEAARAAADRAASLARETTDTDRRITLLQRAAKAQQDTLEAEKGLLEDQQAARAKDKTALEKQIAEIETRIAKLTELLDALTGKDKTIELRANISKAETELAKITKALAKLASGVTIPVNVQTSGGGVPGFAKGAVPVPGTGNRDNVLAALTPGEVVGTRSGSNLLDIMRYYAAVAPRMVDRVRAALNADQIKPRKLRLPTLPAGSVQAFAGGGVAAPVAAPSEVVLTIRDSGGRQVGRVPTTREASQTLIDLFSQFADVTS